ncbi:hypothetical protein ACS0TY_007537 [Phlomoides rotata]
MSKRSGAWDHFEVFVKEQNEKKTRCIHCSREFHCDPKRNGLLSVSFKASTDP